MTASDLAVDGVVLVEPQRRRPASVYVTGGKIDEISLEKKPARQRIDADGLLMLPGFVDTHVHLMAPAEAQREDWEHGSAAAAFSGVTTIIEHSHRGPVRTPGELAEKLAYVRKRSGVDYGLAAHVWGEAGEHLGDLWRLGVAFFKVFTCATHGVPATLADGLLEVFRTTAGLGAPCLVHAEDDALTAAAERSLRQAGRTDFGLLPEWRSPLAETVAVGEVLAIASETGAPVVLAHASRPEIVEMAQGARGRGTNVFVESCPQYFTLREDEVLTGGPRRKFTPPARARTADDLAAMWALLRTGAITHVSSDHAPATLEQKESGGVWSAPFGLPGLDTTSSILIDAAVRDVISFETVAEVYSRRPAAIYGFKQKGSIEPGKDADFVLVDPAIRRTIAGSEVKSKAGWTPYEGLQVQGGIRGTYLRGRCIADGDRAFLEPGGGAFLPGRGFRPRAGT